MEDGRGEAVRAAALDSAGPYTQPDGSVTIPAVVVVAAATA
jgi:hypothetical protein